MGVELCLGTELFKIGVELCVAYTLITCRIPRQCGGRSGVCWPVCPDPRHRYLYQLLCLQPFFIHFYLSILHSHYLFTLNFYRRWPFFIVSRFSLPLLHIFFQKLNRLKAPPAPPPPSRVAYLIGSGWRSYSYFVTLLCNSLFFSNW
jgi:hypothetical protein